MDEEIASIEVSISQGFGEMNEELSYIFEEKTELQLFETAITTAVKQQIVIDVQESVPDYDVMVVYQSAQGGSLPVHALHLFLAEEDEQSILMYMLDEESYVTTAEATNSLRELLLEK